MRVKVQESVAVHSCTAGSAPRVDSPSEGPRKRGAGRLRTVIVGKRVLPDFPDIGFRESLVPVLLGVHGHETVKILRMERLAAGAAAIAIAVVRGCFRRQ